MKTWFTIATIGITALCAAEAILWLKEIRKGIKTNAITAQETILLTGTTDKTIAKLYFEDDKKADPGKQFDEFSEGLRDKRKTNA